MVTEGAFDPTPPEPHTAIRHTRVDRKVEQEKGVSRARPEAPAWELPCLCGKNAREDLIYKAGRLAPHTHRTEAAPLGIWPRCGAGGIERNHLSR